MEYQEYLKYQPILARRAAAALLDYLLFFAIIFAYVHFFGKQNEEGLLEVKGYLHLLAIFVLWFLYFPVIEGALGFTLFKGLFDLKLVQERRRDYRVAVAFKRHILDPIDFFLFGIVAILLTKVRGDHKRLGDMLAHSRIVLDKGSEDVAA